MSVLPRGCRRKSGVLSQVKALTAHTNAWSGSATVVQTRVQLPHHIYYSSKMTRSELFVTDGKYQMFYECTIITMINLKHGQKKLPFQVRHGFLVYHFYLCYDDLFRIKWDGSEWQLEVTHETPCRGNGWINENACGYFREVLLANIRKGWLSALDDWSLFHSDLQLPSQIRNFAFELINGAAQTLFQDSNYSHVANKSLSVLHGMLPEK